MYIKHKLKNGIELDFDDQNHIYYCNGEKVEKIGRASCRERV